MQLENCMNQNCDLIMSGSEDGCVYAWDVVDSKIKFKLKHANDKTVPCLSYHPEEKKLLSSQENHIYLWVDNEIKLLFVGSYPPHLISSLFGLIYVNHFITFEVEYALLNSSTAGSYFNPNCNEFNVFPFVNTFTGILTKFPASTAKRGTFTSIWEVGKSYSTVLSITL